MVSICAILNNQFCFIETSKPACMFENTGAQTINIILRAQGYIRKLVNVMKLLLL